MAKERKQRFLIPFCEMNKHGKEQGFFSNKAQSLGALRVDYFLYAEKKACTVQMLRLNTIIQQ